MKILSHRIADSQNLQGVFKRFKMGNRWITTFILLMAILAISQPTLAIEPLVDAAWIHDHLNNKTIRILDLQPLSDYRQEHIPGAVHTRYSDWRKTDETGTPGMRPPTDYLEKLIGDLGINNRNHVVLVPPGRQAGDLAMATRIYWTLKVLGHDEISILNGGMAAYINKYPTSVERKNVPPVPTHFTAILRPAHVPDSKDVAKSLQSGDLLVDNRSVGEFTGRLRGDPNERSGTMPGAVNLPFNWLTENGNGRFPDRDALVSFFKEANVPTTGNQIHFCHTGHRASLSWFVSHELLGNHQAKMYDGSMVEWANNPELPMVSETSTDR